MSIETWMPVVGYEGLYEVSDQDRIRSLDRVDCAGRTLKGKVLASVWNGHYRVIRLSKEGVQIQHRFHRIVLTAFRGPCPPNMEGCHGPNGSRDNTLANLRWDTRFENCADKRRNKTQPNGQGIWTAKLDEAAVRLIRKSIAGTRALMADYGLSKSQISKIRLGQSWAHVT